MSTRQAFSPQLHLTALGDQPRLFINVGYKAYSFWFLDCEDLEESLDAAVRFRGLPAYAAAQALEYVRTCFGHYDDDSFGDPAEAVVCTDAAAPAPAFLTTPPGGHAVQELYFWLFAGGVALIEISVLAWSVFQ